MRRVFQLLRGLLQDIKGARRITGDRHSYQRLSGDFILSKLMRLTGKKWKPRPRTIRLKNQQTIHYRLDRADIYTIHEVWIAQEYRLPPSFRANTIIDIGANIGLTSVWLANRCRAHHLVAVEPSAANVRLLKLNLDSNIPSHEIFQAAAGAQDGTAVFDSGPGSTNGRLIRMSSVPALPNESAVPVVSMATLLSSLPHDARVNLVKIDIEGGEQELLSSNLDWLHRVDALLIEFHAALCDYQLLTANLQDCGFTRSSSICSDPASGNTVEFFQKSESEFHPD